MKNDLLDLTCEIELQPGEKLALPESLVNSVGAGRWVITIRPLASASESPLIRDHRASLNSYAPEDEGLYDDYPTR